MTIVALIFLALVTVAGYLTGVIAFIDIFTVSVIFQSPVLTTFVGILGGAFANILLIGVAALRARKGVRNFAKRSRALHGGPGLRFPDRF